MEGKLLTEGNVFTTLMKFAVPFLAANVLQALYGAADLVIVGNFADAAAVSAVATGSQVMQTITGLCVGLTTGGTVVIGQYFGAGNRRQVLNTAATVLGVFGLLALVLTGGMAGMTDQICQWMEVPAQAWMPTRQYLFVCSCGIVFIIGYNAVSGVLRGIGDSRTPLLFVAAACCLNIAGDMVLVGGLHMGAAGAAIATVGAQAASLVLAVGFLMKKGLWHRFWKSKCRIQVFSAGEIMRVGTPLALQEGLINISFLIITAIVNALGVTASAAVGVVEKLIVLSMLPTTAFASAVAAMTAQHQGAGLLKRGRRCLHAGIGMALVLGTAFFLLAQCKGMTMIGLFSKDAAVMEAGNAYLKSYSADCILVCFVFCLNSYFSGCGHAAFPLLHSALTTFLIRIPLSRFFSQSATPSMFLIGCAAPLATLASLLLCEGYLHRPQRIQWSRKHKRLTV